MSVAVREGRIDIVRGAYAGTRTVPWNERVSSGIGS